MIKKIKGKMVELPKYGFLRVGACVPVLKVGDTSFNVQEIINQTKEAVKRGVEIISFPDLSLTGYTAGDLFQQRLLLEQAKKGLEEIVLASKSLPTIILVGLPYEHNNRVFNVSAVVSGGKLFGLVPKTYIPNYKEFYEERWFSSSKDLITKTTKFMGETVEIDHKLLFRLSGRSEVTFGIEVCEDLWVPIPPSSYQSIAGAKIIFNLSASNELVGKAEYRKSLVVNQSARIFAGYIYVSCGVHESSMDVVFSGHTIIAENGTLLTESKRFDRKSQLLISDIDLEHISLERNKTTSFGEKINEAPPQEAFKTIEVFSGKMTSVDSLDRFLDSQPFVPRDSLKRGEVCEEIFSIQVTGLAKRMESSGIKNLIIGISGGLDSTLALLVAFRAVESLSLPRSNILAFSMPGFGTTSRTKSNAQKLCESLGVSFKEIPINKTVREHFKDIGQDENKQDTTYENAQARHRTMILMNKGNQNRGMVVGTGDLSEIALGWCTFSGDHISNYNVNSSIPKTIVKYLVDLVADTQTDEKTKTVLKDIVDTPISPELKKEKRDKISQKTEDLIGHYELHDFFLYHFVRWTTKPSKILFLASEVFKERYSEQIIKKWLVVFIKRFFANQWKRSVMPDGPKVGSVSLSPRGDWRMPSDGEVNLWLKDLDNNKE